jgi:multiple sugar transport system substrate-binding protein
LALATLVAAAVFAGGTKEKSAAGGAQTPAGTGKVVLATNNAPEGRGAAEALKEFAARKGIKYEVVEAPYSNLYEKEVLDLSQGSGLYDVIMLDDPWFTQFAESKWLTNLTPYFTAINEGGLSSDFIDKSTAICKYPYVTGLIYAFPAVGNAQMFFYRKDLFAQYGLNSAPKTWNAAYAVMKKITDSGNGLYGYVLRGQQGNPVVAQFMPIFWSFGGRMFSSDFSKVTIDTPEALNALSFFLKLRDISPPGAASFNAQQLATYMLQGEAASTINWPAFVSTFEDPTQSKVVGKIAYGPIPSAATVGSSEIGHWLAAVPASAKNKQLAFEFIHFMTSAKEQKHLLLRYGTPPTRKSVFTDPTILSQSKFSYLPVLMQAIENSTPRPRIANWNHVENTFGIYLSKAVAGNMSAKAALAAAQSDVTALMKKAGYIK